MKKDEQQTTAEPVITAYTKTQFLASTGLTPAQRDILAAVLEDGRTYTQAEAKTALQAYLRKDVN